MVNNANKYNILVVDEDKSVLDALSLAFEREHNILAATNIRDALTIINLEDVALAIVDHNMPEIKGIELLNRIWRIYPETIRIILTEDASTALLLNAVNKGHIYDYINKPLRIERAKVVVRAGIKDHKKIKASRAKHIRHILYGDSASGNGDLHAWMNGKVSIGSILLKRGLISKDQLEQAVKIQQKEQREIGELMVELDVISSHDLEMARGLQKLEMKTLPETLVELGYVSDEDILSCYALQLGMPYMSLDQLSGDLDLIRLIPAELAYKYNVVPINKLGKVVTLASSEPLSREAQKDIESRIGYRIMVVGVSHRAVRDAVKQYYPGQYFSGTSGAKV